MYVDQKAAQKFTNLMLLQAAKFNLTNESNVPLNFNHFIEWSGPAFVNDTDSNYEWEKLSHVYFKFRVVNFFKWN